VKQGVSNLRENHGLTTFETKFLTLLGLMREEIMKIWVKLYYEELHSAFSTPNIIKSRSM
jgi:hypothetical protein